MESFFWIVVVLVAGIVGWGIYRSRSGGAGAAFGDDFDGDSYDSSDGDDKRRTEMADEPPSASEVAANVGDSGGDSGGGDSGCGGCGGD